MDLNTIEEVVERPGRGDIAGWRPGDAWLGGGTWLFSEPQPHLRRLLDLRGFGWPAIETDRDGVTIAATCRFAELERWTPPSAWSAAALLVPLCCRALWGSFKVWNGATVGGNLCMSLPAGPMAPLAVALDGTCRIWGVAGERDLPVIDFVTGAASNALGLGELLRAIRLPARSLARQAAFRQISLTPHGRSGALVVGTLDRDGAFRLVVTAATVRPLVFAFARLPARSELLDAVTSIPEALIFDDVHGRPAWRRRVSAYLAGEILDELAARCV